MNGGRPLYHVRKADVAARQVGGLMILGALLSLLVFLSEDSGMLTFLLPLSGLLTLGIAYFTLGELLRRQRRAVHAQALVAFSGLHVAGAIGVLAASFFWTGWVIALFCPLLFTLAFTVPVLWHAAKAVGELRIYAAESGRGFEPVLPAQAITPPPAADAAHRSDNSR